MESYEGGKMEWFIRPNMNHPDEMIPELKNYYGNRDYGGHYNGYIIVHKSHPWFESGYDDIDYSNIDVHHGFTFSEICDRIDWPELDKQYRTDEYKCFGWDTCHYNDNSTYWTKERIEEHTSSIAEQAFTEYVKHIKLNNIQDDNQEI